MRERLADQLGADPSAELAALHLEILRTDEVAGGALRADRRAHGETNLRAELTSFVGREAELERVGTLLSERPAGHADRAGRGGQDAAGGRGGAVCAGGAVWRG